jgi:hypothetical protein
LTLLLQETPLFLHGNDVEHRGLLADDVLERQALRHYHDVGLLSPAEVDPDSGYRRYDFATWAYALKP